MSNQHGVQLCWISGQRIALQAGLIFRGFGPDCLARIIDLFTAEAHSLTKAGAGDPNDLPDLPVITGFVNTIAFIRAAKAAISSLLKLLPLSALSSSSTDPVRNAARLK